MKSVNFPFNNDFWEGKFKTLQPHKEKNGECPIPQSHKELGHFVNHQHKLKKQIIYGKLVGTLTAGRIEKLEKLGFAWEVGADPEDIFDKLLQEFIHFQATNGHLKNKWLRKWHSKHQGAMKNGALSKGRQEKLEALDIILRGTTEEDTAAEGTKANEPEDHPESEESEGAALLEAAGIDLQFTLEAKDNAAKNGGERKATARKRRNRK